MSIIKGWHLPQSGQAVQAAEKMSESSVKTELFLNRKIFRIRWCRLGFVLREGVKFWVFT